MDDIKFDSSIDLADRISALEKACTAIIAAINTLPATDLSAINAEMDGFKTDLDGVTGRLDADEKTLAAMGDALKSLSPANVGAITDEIDLIKVRVNAFHLEAFGAANPNIPFPPAVAPGDNSTA